MWKGLGIGFGIGMVLGLLADGVLTGLGLGIVTGFIGWFIGLVMSTRKDHKEAAKLVASDRAARVAVREVRGQSPNATDRVALLEARVASLEARLAKLDGVTSPAAAPPESPPVPVAEPEPVVAPEPSIRPEPPPPPPPREPAKPNPMVGWFTGGNAIVRVGIVVLFIGLAFLARYSIEQGLVPPELRVAGIGIAGIVLLFLGWRLLESRPGYALSLQGAGVGVLYLTVFGALRLYNLIPPEAAFPLLVLIAALATWLAIRQDSAVLAGFGAAGGFVAPVLASTGRGDHVMLFGYFTVLNAAVLGTAWFKSWRSLNLVGFAFTFVIGLLWGARYYRPEHFATVEPFLVIFFLMYVAIVVLFARRAAPTQAGRMVDGTIVFGVPLVGFGMQSALLRGTEMALATSAIVLAAFYLVLAWLLHRRADESYRMLVRAFLALGVVFITVAIPLAFDARWTSAAWAVEGAAVLWMGVRQGRWVPQAFGTLVQLAGGFTFWLAVPGIPRERIFLNGMFLGVCMLAAAGLFSHRALRLSDPAPRLAWLRPVFFAWALVWWVMGVGEDLWDFLPNAPAQNGFIAIMAATMLAFARLHLGGKWREAAWPSAVWMPAMYFLFALSLLEMRHPFAHLGWVVWIFAFAAHWFARHSIEDGTTEARGYAVFHHAGALVLAAVLGGVELRWWAIDSGLAHTAWSAASWVVVPCLALLAVSSRGLESRWPLAAHPRAYRLHGGLVLAAMAFLWILAVNAARPGPGTPLPYMPLLNAIDHAHLLAALATLSWWRALDNWGQTPVSPIPSMARPEWLQGRTAAALAGTAAFVWANGVLLRSLHHWAGVPYDLDSWLRSFVVQASISIFWSVLALGLMVYATRKSQRVLWMIGAALMAVVVVKLALVDFARLGGLERVASFIGVGGLMLVIGYFSPVPPRRKEEAA